MNVFGGTTVGAIARALEEATDPRPVVPQAQPPVEERGRQDGGIVNNVSIKGGGTPITIQTWHMVLVVVVILVLFIVIVYLWMNQKTTAPKSSEEEIKKLAEACTSIAPQAPEKPRAPPKVDLRDPAPDDRYERLKAEAAEAKGEYHGKKDDRDNDEPQYFEEGIETEATI